MAKDHRLGDSRTDGSSGPFGVRFSLQPVVTEAEPVVVDYRDQWGDPRKFCLI